MKLYLACRFLILSSILMTFNYESFSQQNDSDALYYIILGSIDNQAQIFVNEKKIFESEFIEGGGYIFIEVSLDKHLVKGENKVTVVLLNGLCDDCYQNPWGIEYEVFEDDDLVYSISEFSKGEGGNSSGKVWSQTHEIYYE